MLTHSPGIKDFVNRAKGEMISSNHFMIDIATLLKVLEKKGPYHIHIFEFPL